MNAIRRIRIRRPRRRIAEGVVPAVVVALLATGCGELPTTPAPSTELPVTLQVEVEDLSLEALGEARTVTVELKDAAGRPSTPVPLEWTSSDPTVVRVDAEGRIEALANGVARVHVRTAIPGGVASGSGTPSYRSGQLEGAVEVRVHQRLATIELSSPRPSLRMIGELVQLDARALDPLGAPLEREVTLVWESENEAVLVVRETGRVQALAEGAGKIVVEAEEISGELDLLVEARLYLSACVTRGIDGVDDARARADDGVADACGIDSLLRRAQP